MSIKRKELEKKIDEMLEYEQSLSKEVKDEYENLFSSMSLHKRQTFLNTSKTYLINDYVKTITTWYFYLNFFEDREVFEYCSKILQLIDIEEREFKKVFLRLKCKDEEQVNYYNQLITDTKEIVRDVNKQRRTVKI